MEIRDTEDAIVSKLLEDVKSDDEDLWIMSSFDDKDVPESSYMLIGNPDNMAPTVDGEPPSYEVVRYENREFGERDGKQRTKLINLTRGVGNTNAQDWEADTDIGLGVTAEFIKAMRDEISNLYDKIDSEVSNADDYDSKSVHGLPSPFGQDDFDFDYSKLGLLHIDGRTDLATIDSTVNLNEIASDRAYLTLDSDWSINITTSTDDWAPITDYHYTDISFDISDDVNSPRGMAWGANGDNVYVVDGDTAEVHQYELSSSWDITTASYYDSLLVSDEDDSPKAITWDSDGATLYITGTNNADGQSGSYIYEYSLSSDWDITSADFSQSENIYSLSNDSIAHPSSISFESDGDVLYVIDRANSDIFEFDVDTSWDISEMSMSNNKSLGSGSDYISGLSWKSDGSRLETVNGGSNKPFEVTQYEISTPWDIGTMSEDDTIELSTKVENPYAISWGQSGSVFHILDYKNNEIRKYSLRIEANLREL